MAPAEPLWSDRIVDNDDRDQAVNVVLAQVRQLLESSDAALSASHAAIASSQRRTAATEARRSGAASTPLPVDTAAFTSCGRLRATLDQAVIDHEVRLTDTIAGCFDADASRATETPCR